MIKFNELFLTLNNNEVRYMIAGGVAVNLYGIERATADIDIIVELESNNLARFVDSVKALGFKPKIPVKIEDFLSKENRECWIKEKGMMVFSLYDPKAPYFVVDIFVNIPFIFKDVYEKRITINSGKITIPLVPINELMKMKENTGRPKDTADLFYLKKIKDEWNEKQ